MQQRPAAVWTIPFHPDALKSATVMTISAGNGSLIIAVAHPINSCGQSKTCYHYSASPNLAEMIIACVGLEVTVYPLSGGGLRLQYELRSLGSATMRRLAPLFTTRDACDRSLRQASDGGSTFDSWWLCRAVMVFRMAPLNHSFGLESVRHFSTHARTRRNIT